MREQLLRLGHGQLECHRERHGRLFGGPVAVVPADLRKELAGEVGAAVHLRVREPGRVDQGKKRLGERGVQAGKKPGDLVAVDGGARGGMRRRPGCIRLERVLPGSPQVGVGQRAPVRLGVLFEGEGRRGQRHRKVGFRLAPAPGVRAYIVLVDKGLDVTHATK